MYIANTGYGYGDTRVGRALGATARALRQEPPLRLGVGRRGVGQRSAAVLRHGGRLRRLRREGDGGDDLLRPAVLALQHGRQQPELHAADDDARTRPPAAPRARRSPTSRHGATTQTQFGLYRPNLPITSQQVTSSAARPAASGSRVSPPPRPTRTRIIGYPTIDLSAHEPTPNVAPIFFPASPFTLEHSLAFGTERDYLNVSDQFRPTGSGNAGVQRHFTGGAFEIFYSQSADQVAPLISQVNVSNTSSSRDDHGAGDRRLAAVAEVAALVNDGTSWHYLQLTQSSQDPTLWTGTISVVRSIRRCSSRPPTAST